MATRLLLNTCERAVAEITGTVPSSMSAEQRLKVLNLNLPAPPEPFGALELILEVQS